MTSQILGLGLGLVGHVLDSITVDDGTDASASTRIFYRIIMSTHTHTSSELRSRRDSVRALPSVNITAFCHRPNAVILAYHTAAAAEAIRLCLCKQRISRLIPVKAH